MLGFGLVTAIAGAGLALAFLLIRLRIHQVGPASVLIAFLLAELATASIGWDRAARLIGFAELVRDDAADRERTARTMRPASRPLPPLEPSPALEAQSATLDALGPPSPTAEPAGEKP